MSKGQKKKVTVKVMPGEAVVVASVDILEHIISTYVYLSESSTSKEEAQSWINVSQMLQEWVSKTYYRGGDDYEEEW